VSNLNRKPIPSPSSTGFALNIRQRILVNFVLLLLICFLISGLSIIGLKEFRSLFSKFKTVSEDTVLMLKIDYSISELQRAILVFGNTEKNHSVAAISKIHETLISDINNLEKNNSFSAAENNEFLQQMKLGIENFREKINSLQSQRNYYEDWVYTKRILLYERITNNMQTLFSLSEGKENQSLSSSFLQAQRHISDADVLASRYFDEHDLKLRKRVNENFDLALVVLESLKKIKKGIRLSQEDQYLKTLDQLIQELEQAKKTFSTAVQTDRNYLFLVNVVIAGELGELSILAEKLKANSLDQQSNLFSFTEKKIEINQKLVIYASLIGAFLAISIALIMGKRITHPLLAITETFSRLATGENQLEIPGMSRQDEIGRLAQAANVFRETNERTKELLDQTEKFANELKLRELALEQAATKAQEASVAKSQFLANMSHELRTPMNAILGMLSLLNRTELNARQKDYINKTDGAARTLLQLLNDILDISKAEAGKIELDLHPFRIGTLLRDLSVVLSANVGSKSVNLLFDADPSLPPYLIGDALRLQQVLINLGGNAIKFTSEGEVILKVFVAEKTQDAVSLYFSVRDSGIGIAPENQARIFSGFTQAEASTTRRFGGTGLGVAISQRLIELMGGRLELNSVLGEGSNFFFTIRLQIADEIKIRELELEEQNKAVPLNSGQRLKGVHILVVEDNINNQQIARELLELEGATISIADDGEQAVSIIKNTKPLFTIVLMDLQMPVMDGIEATQIIRNQLGLSALPIVAMTANAMTSDREACLSAGMNEHIGKPFDINHLVQVIRQQIGWNTLAKVSDIREREISDFMKEAASAANVDIINTINRMGGKLTLYHRLLTMFVESLSGLESQLTEQIAQGKYVEASRTLHSLKGTAGSMGVTTLFTIASAGEKELANQPNADLAKSVADQVCAAITESIPSLKTLIHSLADEIAATHLHA
jgi:signal transduction histidine kinase/CheY-like chemotaxis protein/HPt (histidine-containing phosphotransfer) domain-containing protein